MADGALLGDKPEEAYFVSCDRTTMTQNDLDNGRLICLIGVAPVQAGRVRDLPHRPVDRRLEAELTEAAMAVLREETPYGAFNFLVALGGEQGTGDEGRSSAASRT